MWNGWLQASVLENNYRATTHHRMRSAAAFVQTLGNKVTRRTSWVFERPTGGSDVTDVHLRREFSPTSRAHIRSGAGTQPLGCARSRWRRCSPGGHRFASHSCSCPGYFAVMETESYEKATGKVFTSSKRANGSMFLWNSSEITQCLLLRSRVIQLVLHESLCLQLKNNWQ